MTMEPTNGEKPQDTKKPFEMVITMDRETLRVGLAGNVQDIDVMMNMLQTALRFLDVQYRITAGIKAQEELKRTKQLLEGIALR